MTKNKEIMRTIKDQESIILCAHSYTTRKNMKYYSKLCRARYIWEKQQRKKKNLVDRELKTMVWGNN